MVVDVACPYFQEEPTPPNIEEPLNAEVKKFYERLRATNTSLWNGCMKLSQLSATAPLVHAKSKHNISKSCFNDSLGIMKDTCPMITSLLKTL